MWGQGMHTSPIHKSKIQIIVLQRWKIFFTIAQKFKLSMYLSSLLILCHSWVFFFRKLYALSHKNFVVAVVVISKNSFVHCLPPLPSSILHCDALCPCGQRKYCVPGEIEVLKLQFSGECYPGGKWSRKGKQYLILSQV